MRDPLLTPVPLTPAGTGCASLRYPRSPKETRPAETKPPHFPTQTPPQGARGAPEAAKPDGFFSACLQQLPGGLHYGSSHFYT